MIISPKSILDQFPPLPVGSPPQGNEPGDGSFRLPGSESFNKDKQRVGGIHARGERDKIASQIRKALELNDKEALELNNKEVPELINKLAQDSFESFVARRVDPLIDFVQIARENPDIQESMTTAFMNVYTQINNLKVGLLQGIIDDTAIIDPVKQRHELDLESRALVILLDGGTISREQRDKIADNIRRDLGLPIKMAQDSFELFGNTVTPLIDFVQIARENPDIQERMTTAFLKVYKPQLNELALHAIIDATAILDPVEQLRALELESQALQIRNNPAEVRGLAAKSIEHIIIAENPSVLTDFATIGRNHPDLAQDMVGVFVEEAVKQGLTPGQIDSLIIASGHPDPVLQASELQRVAREIHATRFPDEDHNIHGHFIDDGSTPVVN